MYTWKRFAMVYDQRDPYKAVADALLMTENKYFVNSTHILREDMSDKQVEHIFEQIGKYARSTLH